MQAMLKRHGAFAVSVPLGAYGAASEMLSKFHASTQKMFDHQFFSWLMFLYPRKRVTLYTTCPWIKELGTVLDPVRRQAFEFHLHLENSHRFVILCPWFPSLVRERLQRMKSALNLQIVRKYLDKKGQPRVVPGLQWVSTLIMIFETNHCNIQQTNTLVVQTPVLMRLGEGILLLQQHIQ